MKPPKEFMERFGIKRTEIIFTKPVKAMVRYGDESFDQIAENVISINVEQNPAFTTISVTYKTDMGEGSIGSAVENFKEIIVVNE